MRTYYVALYRWLVWGNILMALSAAGWVVVTWNHLGLPPDPVLAVLAFALAIVFYTRDRLEPDERAADRLTFPRRVEWIERHRHLLLLWIALALAVALYCIWMRPLAILPLLAGVGFALTYTLRWIPWRGQRWSWKQIPGLKLPYVALLWTILTVFTPVTVYGYRWNHLRLWQVAIAVFLLIGCQILLNDIRDREGDANNKVYTLPVLMGERWARIIGMGAVGGAAILGFVMEQPSIPGVALYTAILFIGYRYDRDSQWRPFIEIQGAVAVVLTIV
jgi:hypothetical protein